MCTQAMVRGGTLKKAILDTWNGDGVLTREMRVGVGIQTKLSTWLGKGGDGADLGNNEG